MSSFKSFNYLTVSQAFEPPAHEKPDPLELAAAAHRVKHTAEFSLDVGSSAHLTRLNAQRLRRCSNHLHMTWRRRVVAVFHTSSEHRTEPQFFHSPAYQSHSLWEKTDSVLELHRSSKIPEAARLSSSLGQLKDTVLHVEDGVRDISRTGWQAFSSITRLIERVHDEIVRQRDTGVADSYQLHKLLTQLSTASREKIDDLIARIDKTRTNTEMGLKVASEVRRDAMAANNELRKRLESRSLPVKLWEAGSLAVQTAEEHSANVLSIQKATTDVQKHLQLVRGRLVDYAANAGEFHSDIDAM